MEYNLEEIVNHRITTLATLMKRQAFKVIAENNIEITPEQWVVMYYLWQENGLSVGEIVNRSKKDFANVTRIIDRLIKMGYIAKRKSKKDGRSFNVFILPKAAGIKNNIQNCWKQASDSALEGISESEQKYLLEIVGKIENNVLRNLE